MGPAKNLRAFFYSIASTLPSIKPTISFTQLLLSRDSAYRLKIPPQTLPRTNKSRHYSLSEKNLKSLFATDNTFTRIAHHQPFLFIALAHKERTRFNKMNVSPNPS
jgi:hypothetical protein